MVNRFRQVSLTIFFLLLVLFCMRMPAALGQGHIEPVLIPGERVPKVRAIACNTANQLADVLEAYSIDYRTGKAAFEAKRKIRDYDGAAGQIAPVCDEVWFTAIIPVRTVSPVPYKVHFADGSVHRRYIIEAMPVGPDRKPAEVSYFISSRWPVRAVDEST